jgi:hypothetical protein
MSEQRPPRPDRATENDHLLAAAKFVLAERERELLELKGPCSSTRCRLHYAHSGPCDTREAPDAA